MIRMGCNWIRPLGGCRRAAWGDRHLLFRMPRPFRLQTAREPARLCSESDKIYKFTQKTLNTHENPTFTKWTSLNPAPEAPLYGQAVFSTVLYALARASRLQEKLGCEEGGGEVEVGGRHVKMLSIYLFICRPFLL